MCHPMWQDANESDRDSDVESESNFCAGRPGSPGNVTNIVTSIQKSMSHTVAPRLFPKFQADFEFLNEKVMVGAFQAPPCTRLRA
jgi:hypothetical protein